MARFPVSLRSFRNLGTNLTIVALLGFGLGTLTLLYTATDRLLLHPLPGIHAETLARMAVKRPQVTTRSFPATTYDAVQAMRSFAGVAAESDFDVSYAAPSGPRRIVAGMVSSNYFALLGVRPRAGQLFSAKADRDEPNTIPVVLSYRFWMSELGGSPAVLGRTIHIGGRPFAVTGVAPRQFYGTALDSSPDLWLPLAAQPLLSRTPLRAEEPDREFDLIGRLRPGIPMARAQAEFATLYAAKERAAKNSNPGTGILEPLAYGAFYLHDQFARALNTLLAGLAIFMAIVCANVAGLLLVRAARRERETAIRIALGASRTRVVVKSLLESLALGLAGAACGIGAAWACAPVAVRLLPRSYTPLPISLEPGWQMAVLAACVTCALSVGFGLPPAWLASHVAPQQSLGGGARSTRRLGLSSRILISIQTCLTLVLLASAALMLRSLQKLRDTDPGFATRHIVTFTLDPSMAGTTTPPPASLAVELLRNIRTLPGVLDASFATAEPLHRVGYKTSVALPGRRITQADFLNTSMNNVSSSFFATLGIPMVSGRVFSEAEAQHLSPAPVVVNEAFARAFFPGQNPLGRFFGQAVPGEVATAKFVVVGVVADAKYRSLRELPPPTYYAPINEREDWGSTMFLYVRTSGPADSVIGEVRGALLGLDKRLPLFDVVTMREQIAESLWQEKLLAALAAVFSVCAILMAAAGLYGHLAFDANQRTREFGIRAALGAMRWDIGAVLIGDVVRILVPGIGAGLIASVLSVRLLSSALYGIAALDPVSLGSAVVLIALIGCAATVGPVYRATRTDPAVVLRQD